MKPLVLGLGNDLLGDDGVGIFAARRLAKAVGHAADVIESSLHGLALMDLMIGYRRVIIVDAIQTGQFAIGSVIELSPEDLRPVLSPSPHYSGLPEMMALAGQLGVEFPSEIRIIAVEIGDVSAIGDGMSPAATDSLAEIETRAIAVLDEWKRSRPRPEKDKTSGMHAMKGVWHA